jgi:hypothetical protein
MAQSFKYFIKGIELRGESSDPTDNAEGSIFQNSSQQKLKTYIESAIREIVTNSQSQTLTNKTINSDNNTISNIVVSNFKAGVLNTSTTLASASNTQVPSALAVKTYIDTGLEGQNQASEITLAPTGTISATNVQDGIAELDGDIQGHINDTSAAHAASAVSNTPSGNLAATDVQAALNELQSDIDTRATSSALSAHTGASSAHGVSGSIVGTSDSQVLTNKTIDSANNTISNIVNSNISATAAIDASKIANGTVSNAEFQYLDGVSSAIQTQIDSKQATITGAATSIISSDLTASRVVTSDASGKITDSSITTTTLGYLDATSSIQTQINSKQATITGAATTITSSDLATAKVLVSDSSGKVAASSVTTTTLGYLDATSSIQTQINSKQATITGAATSITSSDLTASRVVTSDASGKVAASSVTTTTLGYLDATSSIQTQLNSKEANTASNLGSGSGVFAQKVGVDLQFKSLVAGTNVSLSSDASSITINSTGGGGGIPASTSFSLANNISSATNVTSLSFSTATVLAAVIEYSIARSSSTTKATAVGRLRIVYNSLTNVWSTSDDYAGNDTGINFTVTAAGQVQYTSTNYSGTSYVGTLQYITLITYAP